MKTVRRNTRLFSAIFANATEATSHTLDNGFVGQPVRLEWLRESGEAEARRYDATVRDNGEGRYTVRYHGNSWINITAPEAAAKAKARRSRKARKAA